MELMANLVWQNNRETDYHTDSMSGARRSECHQFDNLPHLPQPSSIDQAVSMKIPMFQWPTKNGEVKPGQYILSGLSDKHSSS